MLLKTLPMIKPVHPDLRPAHPQIGKEIEALSQAMRALDYSARKQFCTILGMLDQAEDHLTSARRESNASSPALQQSKDTLKLHLDSCRRLLAKAGELLGVLEGK